MPYQTDHEGKLVPNTTACTLPEWDVAVGAGLLQVKECIIMCSYVNHDIDMGTRCRVTGTSASSLQILIKFSERIWTKTVASLPMHICI